MAPRSPPWLLEALRRAPIVRPGRAAWWRVLGGGLRRSHGDYRVYRVYLVYLVYIVIMIVILYI